MANEKSLLDLNIMPKTVIELTENICHQKKVAYITLESNMISAQCKVVKIPTPVQDMWNGLLLRYNSPFKKIFNRM